MDVIQPLMELLQLLGTLGAYTLAVAVTAIVGFLAFKLTQLLSILLLIKYVITKFHDWAITKKTSVTVVDRTINFMIGDLLVSNQKNENADKLVAIFKRLPRVRNPNTKYDYIHTSDIEILEEAIEYLEEKYKKKV